MNPRIISSVDDLSPLLSLIRTAARCLEPRELLDFTLRGFVASRPHIRRAEVRLLEGERLARTAVVCSDEDDRSPGAWDELDGRPLGLDHAVLGPVVRYGESRWARDENGWDERPDWAVRNGVLSYYAAPLVEGERCLGLFVSWRTARYNSDVLHGRAKLWKESIAGLLAARLPGTHDYEARGRAIARNSPFRQWWDMGHCIIAILGVTILVDVVTQVHHEIEIVTPSDSGVDVEIAVRVL